MQRETPRRTWTQWIETAVAISALLVTLAIVVWMAGTIHSVEGVGDVREPMWLVGHRFVRPVAIALIALVWVVEDRADGFETRAALTCALFLFVVVLLDAGTWALIQGSPAVPAAPDVPTVGAGSDVLAARLRGSPHDAVSWLLFRGD